MNQAKRLFLILALASVPLIAHASDPNPSAIYVQSITYGGSGTPQGSVAASFSDDRTVFTLIFDSFVASRGPGIPITESRKNSQLNLNLHVGGHGRLNTDVRGYIQLPAGSKAVVTLVALDAKGHGKTFKQTFVGPVSKDYLLSSEVKIKDKSSLASTSVVPEYLQLQVSIDGPVDAQAQATVDSIDAKLTTNVKGSHDEGSHDDDDADADEGDDD